MKGFIEVEGKYENKGKVLIAVSDIIRVHPTGFEDDQTYILTKNWGLFTDETYEEIKKKIEQAQGENK